MYEIHCAGMVVAINLTYADALMKALSIPGSITVRMAVA